MSKQHQPRQRTRAAAFTTATAAHQNGLPVLQQFPPPHKEGTNKKGEANLKAFFPFSLTLRLISSPFDGQQQPPKWSIKLESSCAKWKSSYLLGSLMENDEIWKENTGEQIWKICPGKMNATEWRQIYANVLCLASAKACLSVQVVHLFHMFPLLIIFTDSYYCHPSPPFHHQCFILPSLHFAPYHCQFWSRKSSLSLSFSQLPLIKAVTKRLSYLLCTNYRQCFRLDKVRTASFPSSSPLSFSTFLTTIRH